MPNPAVAPAAGGADVNALNGEIASLQEALALERAKNEVLLEQCLKTEDALADKDVEGFADVIPNDGGCYQNCHQKSAEVLPNCYQIRG